MTEDMEPIAKALVKQFTSVWKMLRAAVKKVPDERWHDGVGQWYYSQTAYHIIETAQFYLGNDPDEMKWGSRADIIWDDVENIERQFDVYDALYAWCRLDVAAISDYGPRQMP